MHHTIPDLLTEAQAMQELKLSKSSMQRHRRSGLLPFRKIGGKVRYTPSDLHIFLERTALNLSPNLRTHSHNARDRF